MDIPQTLIDDFFLSEVNVGDVYKIAMSKTDGITPKAGYTTRNKYFVVLGFDNIGNVYGGVVFNSKINQSLLPIVRQYHMPMSAEKYTFLSHNSFLNCAQLLTTTATRIMQGEKVGSINEEDLRLICATICSYPNASPIMLKRFNLI